jgi:hypothetical protein
MSRTTKPWVIVQMTDGSVKIWRDYGQAWGSPAYTVVGYLDSYREAALAAQAIRVHGPSVLKGSEEATR